MVELCLAQINIARLRAPIDDPSIKEFVDALDHVNALGDRSPGFVWRLHSDLGAAVDIRAYDDPLIIINMTMWRSVEALRNFAYRSEHVSYFRRRREWFEPMDTPSVALCWVPEDHRPTFEEGRDRLDHLTAHGPSPYAFTFATISPPEHVPRPAAP